MAFGTSLLLWPFKAISNLVSFLINGIVSIILLPIKIIQSVIRSLYARFQSKLAWVEPKLTYFRSTKPFVYFLPVQHKGGVDDDVDLLSAVPSTPPVLGVTTGRDRRSLTTRSVLKRRPPTHGPSDEEDASGSMSDLIQELLDFSKQHQSPSKDKTLVPPAINSVEEENVKVMKLIKDLQEIANCKNQLVSHKKSDQSEETYDPELEQLLSDLGVLESYVSHFLDEQESTDTGQLTDMPVVFDNGSLETITEEDTSKECSPLYGSPTPRRAMSDPPTDVVTHKVTDSEEIQLLLKQIADTIHQTENIQRETKNDSHLSPQKVATQQFIETDREFKSVIDSLENQHKFIETQQELQEMMDSLDPSNITSPVPSPAITHESQLYDSLNQQLPLYSVVDKKTTTSDNTTLQQENNNQIYDSIANVTMETTLNDTPPPIPLKRVPSDGGMSTSSNDYSPKGERRHSSGDEEQRHSSHHRSRRHRRHSSRKSECHCCCYDDHSPERCGHHHSHRPRSKERHHHRHGKHHHRSRSESDESEFRRRFPRESSGYESQDLESPNLQRKVKRSNSDVPPLTPKEARRGFLGGLFSKRSTTSLTSLSSKMSDSGDNYSVSSYKM